VVDNPLADISSSVLYSACHIDLPAFRDDSHVTLILL
jgi:Ca2+-binding EF-hand superfamily protein